MTQLDYLEKLREEFDQCVQLSKKKNSDYANPDDAFANFRLVEIVTNGKLTTDYVILCRFIEKMQRATNLMFRPGMVADEPITDTLRDIAILSIILKIFLEEKK